MDLSTTYMGMRLKNPLVPSASPLSRTLDGIRRLEDAGAGAVVMYSLFEEEITQESHALDHFLSYGEESHPEATSYFPEPGDCGVGPQEYLELLRSAKQAVDIPVIASLNGVSIGAWADYAQLMERAGADAIELNIYYVPTDPAVSGQEIEQRYVDVVYAVGSTVSIPLAVKISPYFSSTANVARRLADAGANALVLFNRFDQPDFDLAGLEVVPTLELSHSYELRLPLHWVAILYRRVFVDFAITTGIHTHTDVIKAIMAGANVTQIASELLRNGIGRIPEILNAVNHWMEEFEYSSIRQMRGSMSQVNVHDPDVFKRANYRKVLNSFRPDPTGRLL
jgi:dihydroorotate dehydrogenase (fumarate)